MTHYIKVKKERLALEIIFFNFIKICVYSIHNFLQLTYEANQPILIPSFLCKVQVL